jgi:predicted O-methyltransferase YrrM
MDKIDRFFIMRPKNTSQMDGLYDLIEYINEVGDVSNMKLVEIGAYVGESTTIFADRFKKVITIDPYQNDYDMTDKACLHADFGKVFDTFCKRTENYNNIFLIKKNSDEAYDDLSDSELYDVVYIDGLHQYEQVKTDIANFRNIVKPGGFICGHDYSGFFPGVRKAVDESLGKPDNIFQDKSWIKQL